MGATEGFLKGEIKTLVDKLRDKEEEIKKLNERIRFLEECLDNKEKVNISLREENKEMNERIRYLEQCLDMKEKIFSQLREENKRLSDFLECES